ncbi:MAG: hypothetical protein ACYC9Z_14445 [Casimicrobiaceae bacterium]
MAMKITSAAFAPGGAIPTRYTCEGGNASPPLACVSSITTPVAWRA